MRSPCASPRPPASRRRRSRSRSCDALARRSAASRPRSHAAEAGEDVVDLAGVGAGVEQRPRVAAARVVAGHDREPAQRPARARSTPPPSRRATRATRAWRLRAHRDRSLHGLANALHELLARQVQAGHARRGCRPPCRRRRARRATRGRDVDRLIGQHDDDALDARRRPAPSCRAGSASRSRAVGQRQARALLGRQRPARRRARRWSARSGSGGRPTGSRCAAARRARAARSNRRARCAGRRRRRRAR